MRIKQILSQWDTPSVQAHRVNIRNGRVQAAMQPFPGLRESVAELCQKLAISEAPIVVYQDWVAESMKTKQDLWNTDVFIQQFQGVPKFLKTRVGQAALQFEAYLIEENGPLWLQFVESFVEGENFFAVFTGQLEEPDVITMRGSLKECCEIEWVVCAGDISHAKGVVSTINIFRCQPTESVKTKIAIPTNVYDMAKDQEMMGKEGATFSRQTFRDESYTPYLVAKLQMESGKTKTFTYRSLFDTWAVDRTTKGIFLCVEDTIIQLPHEWDEVVEVMRFTSAAYAGMPMEADAMLESFFKALKASLKGPKTALREGVLTRVQAYRDAFIKQNAAIRRAVCQWYAEATTLNATADDSMKLAKAIRERLGACASEPRYAGREIGPKHDNVGAVISLKTAAGYRVAARIGIFPGGIVKVTMVKEEGGSDDPYDSLEVMHGETFTDVAIPSHIDHVVNEIKDRMQAIDYLAVDADASEAANEVDAAAPVVQLIKEHCKHQGMLAGACYTAIRESTDVPVEDFQRIWNALTEKGYLRGKEEAKHWTAAHKKWDKLCR